MSKWILKESWGVTREQLEPSGRGDRLGIARGVILSEVDQVNQNGRIYERREFEGALSRYMPTIEARKSIGELDHPLTSDIERNQLVMLQNVSHVISECRWVDNTFQGNVEFLDTPSGRIGHNIVEAGVPIGTSSRGFGELVVESKGNFVRDYEIICWDLVGDPSVKVSKMRLDEARKNNGTGVLQESRRRITSPPADIGRVLAAAHEVFGSM